MNTHTHTHSATTQKATSIPKLFDLFNNKLDDSTVSRLCTTFGLLHLKSLMPNEIQKILFAIVFYAPEILRGYRSETAFFTKENISFARQLKENNHTESQISHVAELSQRCWSFTPDEILYMIFKQVKIDERSKIKLVCKKWKRAADRFPFVYKGIKEGGRTSNPSAIAVKHGKIYIAYGGTENVIRTFDIGDTKLTNTAFSVFASNYHNGIDVSDCGTYIYATASYGGSVHKIDRNGKRVKLIGGKKSKTQEGLSSPCNVKICSATGNVVVSDTDNNRIQIYNNKGSWIKGLRCKMSKSKNNCTISPSSIALDDKGYVYVCSALSSFLYVYDTKTGEVVKKLRAAKPNGVVVPLSPTSVFIDREQNIVVGDLYGGGTLQWFSSDGEWLCEYANTGDFGDFCPYSIAQDEEGVYYVLDVNPRDCSRSRVLTGILKPKQ